MDYMQNLLIYGNIIKFCNGNKMYKTKNDNLLKPRIFLYIRLDSILEKLYVFQRVKRNKRYFFKK